MSPTGLDAAQKRLDHRKDLTATEMTAAMEAIVGGHATDDAIESFLSALRKKGELPTEIAAAAAVMRRYAVPLSRTYPELLDTCGTGGDARRTLNVSTLASLVCAGAGVGVAKHGNRSVSSVSGSADLLEALGVTVDPGPLVVESCIQKTGFGFFFAPRFHPATRFAMPARKRIQGKTLFNLLGPLANPAGAAFQLVGVYDEKLVEIFARVLVDLGVRRAFVVHGRDGMDELTTCDETMVAEVDRGSIIRHVVSPEDIGLRRSSVEDLVVTTKEEALAAAHAVLAGERGPKSDIVCLNAGAAFFVSGRSRSIKAGVFLAQETLKSGAALRAVEKIVAATKPGDA